MAFGFHSYFSIHTTSDCSASASEYNPFDEDNHSSYTYSSVSSQDITYNSASGRVTFNVPGTYLVVLDVPVLVDTAVGTVIRIKINGSNVYTSASIYNPGGADPRNTTCHALLGADGGDYLEATIESDSTDQVIAKLGTSLVLFKSNGDYGSLLYETDASASGAGAEIILGNSTEGGTIGTNLNNVTFDTTTGKFTTPTTRKFLMLSTLITEAGASGTVSNKLFANGSLIDELPGRVSIGSDPIELSYGFLKELTATQNASARTQGPDTVIVQQGTAFTILDVTNNGTDPSAYLSLTVDADSNALTTGNKKCFDANNWTLPMGFVNQVTATGITWNASGGTFVVSEAGKYFILCTIVIGSSTTSAERTMTVMNGATTVYTAPFYVHNNTDPQEKTTCLVVDASAGDSFTFVVTDPHGTFDAGSGITMVKVDFSNQSTPSTHISDDYTINTFTVDRLSSQYSRTAEQVPFTLAARGPESLRGRDTSEPYKPSTGRKRKGPKK